MRRILSGLLMPLFFLAGAALLAAPSAFAAPSFANYGSGGGSGPAAVTVTSGPSGTTVLDATGGGFSAGETVNATVHSTAVSVGSFPANSAGVVSNSITLPGGIPAGTHELILVGTVSGHTDTSAFTLSAPTAGSSPCAASYVTHASGVVLAAAYQTTACASAVPSALGAPSSGTPAAGVPSSGTPAAGAPAASAAAPQGSSQLPFTGANTATGVAVGAMAVAAGGILVLSSRRRRRTAWESK